jgi:hypothetical protein
MKSLNVFSGLCGTYSAKRVALVTTMWDQVPPSAEAQMELREDELRVGFWSTLIQAGVGVYKFDTRTPNQSWKIVASVLEKNFPPQAVLLQEELVDLRHRLSETAAAKVLYNSLMQSMATHKDLLLRLEKHAHANQDSKEAARLKNLIEDVNTQIDKSFKGLQELTIPLARRIALWFSRFF